MPAVETPGWFIPQGLEWAAPAVAYLLGSIPFGLLLVRLVKGTDVRSFGSGNIGATNAMRAGGKPVGFAPVFWIAPALALSAEHTLSLQVQSGAMAVLGHCFPLYLRFRGGKAVSTGCGALLALDWRIALIGGVVWVLALFGLRYTGLASILMGLTFPIAAFLLGAPPTGPLVVGASLLALLIIVRHRPNIQRMMVGAEPKIGKKQTAGVRP